MKNTINHHGKISVINLEKNLEDIADTRDLESLLNGLMAKNTKKIGLDFSKVAHIGSDTVGLLIRKGTELKAKRGFLALYGVKGQVREYIETLGLDQFIQVYEGEPPAK